MKTGQELLAEARKRIKEVNAQEALEMHKRGDVTFFDIRDLQEVNLGKIPGAVHLSKGNLETKVESLIPREANIVVYCANGNRSVFAADTMQVMGYQNVASLAAGIRGWMEAGGDIED